MSVDMTSRCGATLSLKRGAKVYLFLFALFLSSPVTAQQPLRVGVYENPPLSMLDAEGRPTGFVIDLLRHIAQEEGWVLEFVPCKWDECNELLLLGGIQMLSPMSLSEARDRRLDVNRESLYVNWGQIVMAGKEEIHSPLDLDGKTVVAISQDVHFADLKELARRFDINVRFIEVSDYESVLSWVAYGPVDAGLISRSVDLSEGPEASFVKSSVIFNPAEIRIALSPREGLLENAKRAQRLDYHLTRLKGDRNSLYYQLQKRWFAEEQPKLPPWVFWVIGLVSGLALLLAVNVFVLRREVQRQTGKVREANERFRAFMKHLPGIAYMKGMSGKYLFVNSTWEENNYLTDTAVIGKTPAQIWPDHKLDPLQYDEQQAIERGEVIDTVEKHPWDERYWRLIRFPVKNAATQETAVGCIGLDVTEQKRTEEELSSLHHQMQMLLESVGECMLAVNGLGHCTFINPAALELLGYRQEEVIDKKVYDLILHSRPDGSHLPESETGIYQAYKGRRPARVENEVFWDAKNRPIPVEYSAQPLINGEYPGAVIIFRRKKATEEEVQAEGKSRPSQTTSEPA